MSSTSLVLLFLFSLIDLWCAKDCLLKHLTAVKEIKMTKKCKILFNYTGSLYKLDNLLLLDLLCLSFVNYKWAPWRFKNSFLQNTCTILQQHATPIIIFDCGNGDCFSHNEMFHLIRHHYYYFYPAFLLTKSS